MYNPPFLFLNTKNPVAQSPLDFFAFIVSNDLSQNRIHLRQGHKDRCNIDNVVEQ